jgi:hypothetical protein
VSDEIWDIRPRVFRRKRVHETQQDLSPELQALETAKRAGQVMCRNCHRFVPWAKVYCIYEKRGTDLWRVWFHNDCGAMVKEDNMEELTRDL